MVLPLRDIVRLMVFHTRISVSDPTKTFSHLASRIHVSQITLTASITQDATNISLLDGSTDVAAATRGLGPAPAQQNGGPGAAAATGHGMCSSLQN
jgi:hypothetical protein